MEKKFSTAWNSSVQPRKQRKFRFNAPLHVRQKFMSSHLSKELKAKYNRRSVQVRKGDTVKILRGQFKGKSGKIEEVNMAKATVYVAGIEVAKKDGTKARYPINASNLSVTALELTDKKRQQSLEKNNEKSPKKA